MNSLNIYGLTGVVTKHICVGDSIYHYQASYPYPPFNAYRVTFKSDNFPQGVQTDLRAPPPGYSGGRTTWYETFTFTQPGVYNIKLLTDEMKDIDLTIICE